MVIALPSVPTASVSRAPDATLEAREWLLTRVLRERVDATTIIAAGDAAAWILVMAGTSELRVGHELIDLGDGDAALVAPGVPYRVIAHAGSDVVTGDLRPLLALSRVPSTFVARDFAQRHEALKMLVATCPLGAVCSHPIWTRAYANMLGAAMHTAWLQDHADDERTDAAVASVIDALAHAPGDAWTLERMARIAHLSRSALTARFQSALGKAPSDVLRELRMNEARDLLASTVQPIGVVASAVGYGSAAAFSRAFAAHHGLGPQAWREARVLGASA